MPAVSVIVLTWNRGEFLAPALASILDQTMQDLELLVVDNGSTDGSVESFQRSRPDPRMRVLRQESNIGIAAGINLAAASAAAPWIAIMDSDDWSHPRRLEIQLQAAQVDPTLAVIGSGARWMDAAGTPGADHPMWYTPGEIAAFAPWGMPVLHPTLLVRRDVLTAFPHRPGMDLCSDYDWLSRVIEHHRVGVVSLPLLHYRRHAQSITVARAAVSQAAVCAIRLAIARRAAARPDDFAALITEHAGLSGPALELEAVYLHYAAKAAAEGFLLLAAFHAALACRAAPGPLNQVRFLGRLLRAARSMGFAGTLGGIVKGPFWVMLKRAGFPPFPRY